MSEQKIPIPAMLYNAAVGGHVTNSQQIIDEDYNLEQKDVNKEVLGVPYNSTTPNGMGRIVLKKTDNFKQVVEAQTNGNTIFVIKYDFNLGSTQENPVTVNVPTHCTLMFDGGSVTGGTINIANANNVLIVGNGAVLTGRILFAINNSQNVRISDLSLVNYSGGIVITDSKIITIDKCRFENSQSTAIYPNRTHGNECKNIKITNCIFKNVSATSEWGGAIYIDGQGKSEDGDTLETLPIEDIIIDGNSFENIGCAGINLGGASNVVISNNILQKASYNHSMLITTSRETTKVTVCGNFFKGCGFECLVIHYSSNFAVTGNYFEEFGHGVCVESGTRNVTVTGNTFRGLKDVKIYNHENDMTQAVTLSSCEHVTVSSNTIEDCTHGVSLVAGNDFNIIGNTIEATAGIYKHGSSVIDLCKVSGNLIKSTACIHIGSGEKLTIDNNTLIGTTENSYGIYLGILNTGHQVSIKNNTIKASIGLDFTGLYNPDGGKIIIVNNEIEATVTPLKKLYFNCSSGEIYWNNPCITLGPSNVVQVYDVNSIVHFDHTNFNTVDDLPSGSASLAYYMGLPPHGVTYVMSDRSVVQITGGGGSTQVTTRELVPAMPQS